jgi:hypothetical protein
MFEASSTCIEASARDLSLLVSPCSCPQLRLEQAERGARSPHECRRTRRCNRRRCGTMSAAAERLDVRLPHRLSLRLSLDSECSSRCRRPPPDWRDHRPQTLGTVLRRSHRCPSCIPDIRFHRHWDRAGHRNRSLLQRAVWRRARRRLGRHRELGCLDLHLGRADYLAPQASAWGSLTMRLKLAAPVLEGRIAFVYRTVWRRSLRAIRYAAKSP